MRHFLFFILSFIFLHLNANSQDIETLMLCHEKQVQLADSLYKNYLPQNNFEEVKSAVIFYDSIFDNASKHQKRKLSKQRNDFHFKRAKAHYYHAVGLLEQEETPEACGHYLKALEIMKVYYPKETNCINKNVTAAELDETQYRRVRFVSLLYNRLGEIFLEENYLDLALKKYKFALEYCDILEERNATAAILMQIGSAYYVLNKDDSTLYFYNESLKISSDSMIKLDIDKTKARILFDKGEKDTAYTIIRNNLSKLDENYPPRYSYYHILGDFYFEDKEYDSAIYYWEKGAESSYYYTKLACIESLSDIYDSIGDYEKKAYYDGITAKLSLEGLDKSLEKASLQNVYDGYVKRMNKTEKSENRLKTAAILTLLMILSVSCMIILRAKNRKRLAEKTDIIENKEKYISDLEHERSVIKGRIQSANKKAKENEELLKKYKNELSELTNTLERKYNNTSSLENYLKSEICLKIFSQIDELSKNGKKTSELPALEKKDLVLLLQSANLHLNNLITNLSNQHPSLKSDDLYNICLIIMELNTTQIASVLGVSYNTAKRAEIRISSTFGINRSDIRRFIINIL